MHFLVVEDDIDNRDLLVFALEGEGAKVIAVESAQQALKFLEQFRPDAILCDIQLQDNNGYKLLQQWREHEAKLGLSPLPAIAVTAFVMEQDKQKAYDSGFQLHLAKPIDVDKLSDFVASVVFRQEECKTT